MTTNKQEQEQALTKRDDSTSRLSEAEIVTRDGQVKPRLQPDMNGVVSFGSDSDDPSRHPYNMAEVLKGEDMHRGNFDLLPENYPDRDKVNKVRSHEGWVIARHDQTGFWKIVGQTAKDTRPVPQELGGSFTVLDSAIRAINKYKGLME